MARTWATLVASIAIVAAGCGDGRSTMPVSTTGPTALTLPTTNPLPSPPSSSQQGGPVTFSGLTSEGSAVTSYAESGFTIAATSGSWQAGTNYGNPRPFIRFQAQGGTTVVGGIQVSAGGAPFSFRSVDLYASTTPIPYVITGLRNSATVFTESGTLPNTFGQFRTVSGRNATQIDTLVITLTNAAAPCCTNPMGVDNIDVTK